MHELKSTELPFIAWGELIGATGIEERQLRSAMDRGLISLGVKRSNRILFTLPELFAVNVVAALTSNWVPVSVACTAATTVLPSYNSAKSFFTDVYLDQVAPSASFAHFGETARIGARLKVARDSYGPDSPDLRLVMANAGDSMAIGLRSSDTDWRSTGGDLPVMDGRLPIETTVSLVQAFIREALFCIGFYSVADEGGDA